MIWQACVKKSRRKRFVSWIRFLNKQFEEIKLSECKWYLETLRTHGFELPTTRFLFCVLKVHLNMTRMTCWFFQLAPGKEVRQTTVSWEWNLLLLQQLKFLWNTSATTTVILIKALFIYLFLSTRGLPNQTHKVISMFDLSDFYAGYSSWHNPRGICVSFQHQNRDLMFVRQLLPLIITMIMF